uniref:Uncharacterized protein n=1 Tax=Hyaloperonospora arabidopsidis (strain Emoy2) TaxID=559515 RepID=M4BXT4_HYAAE
MSLGWSCSWNVGGHCTVPARHDQDATAVCPRVFQSWRLPWYLLRTFSCCCWISSRGSILPSCIWQLLLQVKWYVPALGRAKAASITTPLDVVKTRLMLGKDAKGVPYEGAVSTLSRVYNEEGFKRLFSGVGPRTMWISIGGFVFFGMYEKAVSTFAAIA